MVFYKMCLWLLVCVCMGGWFGSGIRLCRLLVDVILCSISVVYVRWVWVCVGEFRSDIGLCWLLVAVSLCSVSVVFVYALV